MGEKKVGSGNKKEKNGKRDWKIKKAQGKLFIHKVLMGKFGPYVNKDYP